MDKCNKCKKEFFDKEYRLMTINKKKYAEICLRCVKRYGLKAYVKANSRVDKLKHIPVDTEYMRCETCDKPINYLDFFITNAHNVQWCLKCIIKHNWFNELYRKNLEYENMINYHNLAETSGEKKKS